MGCKIKSRSFHNHPSLKRICISLCPVGTMCQPPHWMRFIHSFRGDCVCAPPPPMFHGADVGRRVVSGRRCWMRSASYLCPSYWDVPHIVKAPYSAAPLFIFGAARWWFSSTSVVSRGQVDWCNISVCFCSFKVNLSLTLWNALCVRVTVEWMDDATYWLTAGPFTLNSRWTSFTFDSCCSFKNI